MKILLQQKTSLGTTPFSESQAAAAFPRGRREISLVQDQRQKHDQKKYSYLISVGKKACPREPEHFAAD